MTYKEAEQRLKELLSTGFLVDVDFEEDLSLKVEKLLHSTYSKDSSLFQVGEVWEDGVFEEAGFEDTWVAGMWRYFGIVNGATYLSDEPCFVPILLPQKLEEIVNSFIKGGETTINSKFEAVSGDQSLFDLVEATDEHLYMIFNKRHTGIYAITQKDKDCAAYNNSVVLAERRLKEPEFIPYSTDLYIHKHESLRDVRIDAFRSLEGDSCINVGFGASNVEVVLSPASTIRFANELIAIANGVERKE